jgi:GntR family transcriptional regulator
MHSSGREELLMKIIIANASDLPIYQQIKDQIKDAILQGELTEGQRLPSLRELANDLHVSVLTTRRVYDELETEGFVVSKPGKGSFVATANLELLRESKRHMVEVKLMEAWETARSLGIPKSELYAMMNLIFAEEDKD